MVFSHQPLESQVCVGVGIRDVMNHLPESPPALTIRCIELRVAQSFDCRSDHGRKVSNLRDLAVAFFVVEHSESWEFGETRRVDSVNVGSLSYSPDSSLNRERRPIPTRKRH